MAGIKGAFVRWLLRDMTPGVRLLDTYGGSAAGVPVSEDSAMRMATVNACVRVLSEDVASLPKHLYKRTPGGGKERAHGHPLYEILHDQPNPEMTAFTFEQTLMVNLLLTGNGYAFIEFDRGGRVMALWPLPSSQVEPFRDGDAMRYRVRGYREVDACEMLHVPGMGYDGLKGLSPIAYAREAIGLGLAAEEFGSRYFSNGTNIGGVVETPVGLSEEAYERLRSEFASAYRGLQKAHGIPILEDGAVFKPMGASQKDAQFLDTRKYQRSEIAAIFRVPPHMIGDLDKATFGNIEHQSIEYLQRSLVPWLVRIEQEEKRKLLGDGERAEYVIEHDTANFLRGDTVSRMQAYGTAIQNGIMSPNECRERENLNPKPGGDELLSPLNMRPASARGADGDARGRFPAWGSRGGRQGFSHGGERRAADADTDAALNRFGVTGAQYAELSKATREWIRAQAKDLLKRIDADEGRSLARQRRARSSAHLAQMVNSYYQEVHKEGAKALEAAVKRGEFPGWQNMTDAIRGMADTAMEDVKAQLGAVEGLDDSWARGFMERYHTDMGARLAAANQQELVRTINSATANGRDASAALEGALGRWFNLPDRSKGMALNEVAMCVNEMKTAAYRKAGYTSIWRSAPACCPICTRLNGRTVVTLKPPLHKGCACTVAVGERLRNELTKPENPAKLCSDSDIRSWIRSDDCVKAIREGQQNKHIQDTNEFTQYADKLKAVGEYGPSRMNGTIDEIGTLILEYAGTGEYRYRDDGTWMNSEDVTTNKVVGTVVNNLNGAEIETNSMRIHYSKYGAHAVPNYPKKERSQ